MSAPWSSGGSATDSCEHLLQQASQPPGTVSVSGAMSAHAGKASKRASELRQALLVDTLEQGVWCTGSHPEQDSVRIRGYALPPEENKASYGLSETGSHHGCFMISGMVMRLRGSTTKRRSSRSQTSADSASLLSWMKGDSFQVLFTSCSLHAWRKRPH